METVNCQIRGLVNYPMHGQDSQDLFHERKGHRQDTHGPGETSFILLNERPLDGRHDEEFIHTMKNACRKLGIPMPTAMPCKTPANCREETCRNLEKHKTKHACIVDADESMRTRLEGVPKGIPKITSLHKEYID